MINTGRLLKKRLSASCFIIFSHGLSFFVFTLIISAGCKNSQSNPAVTTLSFRLIPYDAAEIAAPGRGAEQWHDQDRVNITGDSVNIKKLDKYYRFSWKDIEKENGEYDWTAFDRELNDAIRNKQKFGFGIMPAYPGGVSELKDNEATLFYPLYLHGQMQSEPVKDWISPISKMWVPNWNSEYYLAAMERLNQAINNHLDTGSYKDIKYKHVINYIDIRGYGSYGEWHSHEIVENMSDYPAGTRAATASLIRIIDAHVKKFSNYPLVIMFNAFDGNRLNNTKTAPEVAYHALTVRNNWGLIGWRRDNWGALDDYIRQYTDKNKIEFNEMRFDTAIMNRYKYAPVNGEPIPGGSFKDGCDYGDMEAQVKRYHASLLSNGNFSDYSKPCMQENIRKASKAAGYRLILEGGDISPVIDPGQPFFIMLQWKNIGIAPTYEDWIVLFEIKDSNNNKVWADTSQFTPELFIPQPDFTAITDQFIFPGNLSAGNYKLNLIIRDPNGYRQPLPLAIEGQNDDGSYTLKTITVSSKQNRKSKKK
jgi:hypothetical protein